MIEIVVLITITGVITITAMLMSAVGVYSLGTFRTSKVSAARLDVGNALASLEVYRATKGRYPNPAEGFAPVIKIRALKSTPKDPWGNPLLWELREGEPVVLSLGADGAKGGLDDNADLSSADAEAPTTVP